MLCVHRYMRDGKDKAMVECERRMQELTLKMETITEEGKELEGEITLLNKQLANAKVHIPFFFTYHSLNVLMPLCIQ